MELQAVRREERRLGGSYALALALVLSLIMGWQVRNGAFRELSDFMTIFMSILLEAFPFVILGTLISSAINLFVTPTVLTRVIPKNRFLGLFAASLTGFAFPICECANVPVTRRLIAKGLPTPVAVTFLLSVAIVNPVVLLSTWIAFGGSWTSVLARGGFGMGIAILAGLIVGFVKSYEHPLKEGPAALGGASAGSGSASGPEACGCGHDHGLDEEHVHGPACGHDHGHHEGDGHKHGQADAHAHKPAPRRSLATLAGEVLSHTSGELFDVGRYLIMGAAVASLMQVVLPRASLIGIGMNPLISVLTLMALAYVLSLCSEADAFIAATFAGYFTPGAVLAFMVFGPMMDVKNTLMLLDGFKPRFVTGLVVITTALCLAAGLAVNLSGLIGAW